MPLDPIYNRPSAGPGSAWYLGAPPNAADFINGPYYEGVDGTFQQPWFRRYNTTSGVDAKPLINLPSPLSRAALQACQVVAYHHRGDVFSLETVQILINYVSITGVVHDSFVALQMGPGLLLHTYVPGGSPAIGDYQDTLLGGLNIPADCAYVHGISMVYDGNQGTEPSLSSVRSSLQSIQIRTWASAGFGPNNGVDAPLPALGVVKTIIPPTLQVDEFGVVGITATNSGEFPVTGVAISDPDNPAFPYDGPWSGAVAGVTIAPGTSHSVTRAIKAVTPGSYQNTAQVSGAGAPISAGQASLTITPIGVIQTTLSVNKTFTPATVVVGQNATLRTVITNTGSGNAIDVVFQPDSAPNAPGGLDYIGGWAPSNLGPFSLAPGASQIFEITVRGAIGTYTCTARASASNAPVVSNSANITITAGAPGEPVLSVTKTIVPAVVALGESATLTVSVTNIGDSTATDVVITDPNSSAFPWAPGSGTPFPSSPVNLSPGLSTQITTEVVATTVGTYTNTATITSSNATTKTATAPIQITQEGVVEGLAIRIGACKATACPGEVLKVSAEIQNTSLVSKTFNASALTPSEVSRMRWDVLTDGGARSQANEDIAENAGNYEDTLTIPPGDMVVLDFDLISKPSVPLGTKFSLVLTVDGTAYSVVLEVLDDFFAGSRGTLNAIELVNALLGQSDSAVERSCGVSSLQDQINRGLRLWHLVDDLAKRRGYSTIETVCGCRVHS